MTWAHSGTGRALGVVAALVAALALAGCTSASPSVPGSSPPSSHELTAITPIAATTANTRVSSSLPASTSAKVSPSVTSSKPTPPGLLTCTSAQLGIRALRGGALAGQEIALITFTNIGATECVMFGYPGVSLRLRNALLGQPAQRSIKQPSTVSLAPGAAAETTITDISSCQAPVSDTVRVYAPDQKPFVDKPLELRGCRLFIDPVRPSS